MRSVREILRLSLDLKFSANDIHRIVALSRGVVQKYINAAKAQGVTWQAVEQLDDQALEKLLAPAEEPAPSKYDAPDCEWIHRELKKRGVNMQLLWMEYSEVPVNAKKYSYSQFKRIYQEWRKRQ